MKKDKFYWEDFNFLASAQKRTCSVILFGFITTLKIKHF